MTFTLSTPMPTLRTNGHVTVGQSHVRIGTWAQLDGPGYRIECACGWSMQRFLKSEIREQMHRHLEAVHRRRS